MKKPLPILFILLFLQITAQTVYTQNQVREHIDSLLSELPQLKETTEKVDLLNSLSRKYYSNGNRDSAFSYAEQALKLSEKLHFKKGKATALGYIGNHYADLGETDKSLDTYQKALDISKNIGDKQAMVYNLQNIGLQYAELSDFSKAMENYQHALEITKEINDQKLTITVYKKIGQCAKKLSNYPLALENFQQALKISEKSGDKQNTAEILNSIGWLYRNLGDADKALDFLNRVLETYLQLENKWGVSDALSAIGNIYMNLPDYEKSITFYTRAIELKKELNHDAGLASDYLNIAGVYQFISDYPTALKYLKNASDINVKLKNNRLELFYLMNMGILLQNAPDSILVSIDIKPEHRYQTMVDQQSHALTLAKELDDSDLKRQVLHLLTIAYEKDGNFKSAYYNLQDHYNLVDSIQGQSVREEIVRKEVQYDYEKKADAVKAEQEKKNIRQRTIRNSLTAGLAAFFLFSVIIYRQRNKVKKEKKRSDDLLLNILPEEVAAELKTTGASETRHFDSVSIMFTDFKDFTKLSEKIPSTELIEELNYCFKAFDEIIEKHGIEKIKTIGDAYMAVCGLHAPQENHAKRMIEAALEIRDFMEDYKEKRQKEGKTFFEMRIGINSGEVVAGIVGIKKFAYDIWGDAVNIASRMESNGKVGKVNISESTYNLAKDGFDFRHRGEIETKGKGKINMYFVEQKKKSRMEFEKMKDFILEKLEKELPKNLKYHSVAHILDVYHTAIQYAEMEKINETDTVLLKTASLFHDSGFIIQPQDHEKISCGIAQDHLPRFGYSQEQIDKINGMIMATKIPQAPKTHLEEILADADLDYLGRNDFEQISNKLYEELGLNDKNEWNKIQISFFENHTYFTESARRLRNEKKQLNLKEIIEQTDLS